MTKRKVTDLPRGYNSGFSGNPRTSKDSKGANKRADGEMYKRPEPNPFTSEWMAGYADGMDGFGYNPLPAGGNPQNYRDGYETGKAEARELDSIGSSNA